MFSPRMDTNEARMHTNWFCRISEETFRDNSCPGAACFVKFVVKFLHECARMKHELTLINYLEARESFRDNSCYRQSLFREIRGMFLHEWTRMNHELTLINYLEARESFRDNSCCRRSLFRVIRGNVFSTNGHE